MNLIRLLAIAAVVWLLLYYWRRLRDRRRTRPAIRQTRTARVIRCDHCGVHVPESDAVLRGGHSYCSVEHLELSEGVDGDE